VVLTKIYETDPVQPNGSKNIRTSFREVPQKLILLPIKCAFFRLLTEDGFTNSFGLWTKWTVLKFSHSEKLFKKISNKVFLSSEQCFGVES